MGMYDLWEQLSCGEEITHHVAPVDRLIDWLIRCIARCIDWSIDWLIDWLIVYMCSSPNEAVNALIKRVKHRDPHVNVLALVLLDAFVANAKRKFLVEISSSFFVEEVRGIFKDSHVSISAFPSWINPFFRMLKYHVIFWGNSLEA